MKNILVPTDFSEYADFAVDAAIMLGKKHGATVHFLHSIRSLGDIVQLDTFASGDFASTSVSTDQIIAMIDMKTKEAKNNLAELEKKAVNEGVAVQTHVKQSAIEDAVNQLLKEESVDFIIMGSHGASGISEILIGSNAQKVVRNAEVPVLILKEPLKGDIDHIVYASNFEESEVNFNIPKAGEMSNLLNAELHFLFVNTPGYFEDTETTLEKMKKACDVYPAAKKHIYNEFSVEDGILAFARVNNMDAICITTHGYKALRRIFNNNIVEHLVNHCKRPIISLNMKK